jgi:hypothetical protein
MAVWRVPVLSNQLLSVKRRSELLTHIRTGFYDKVFREVAEKSAPQAKVALALTHAAANHQFESDKLLNFKIDY